MEEGRLTRLRCAAAAGAVALIVLAEIAAPAGDAWLALLDASVALAFAAGAAAVAGVAPRTADLALATAVAWALGTLVGGDLTLLHRAPLAVLVMTYPERPVRELPIIAIALAALAAPFAPDASSTSAAVALMAALAAAAGAANTAPVLRAPRAAAALAGVAIAGTAVAGAAEVGDATALLVIYEIALLAVAVGLLVPLAAGRWGAAAATGLALELGHGPPGAPVTAGLAAVLQDPSLELRLRLPGGSWTDEAGRTAPEPAAHDGRVVTRRSLADGTEVALVHDPATIADPAAAESAVAVAATAVDNARREGEVRERIEQLRRLRRGLLEAADEERRALEEELRVGPLREADAIAALLPDGELARELAVIRAELVEISRGLYPATLAHDGLIAALRSAAARSPIPVTVQSRLDDTTLPRPIALAAYYVATEALANVAKHAGAASARLELGTAAGELLLRVSDDGTGGADPAGGGLSGLRDRVAAVDGELRIHSPAGGGTVVEARLPLP
jgi:Histidine kinase-, DNA gyrase B-, and HSP90-like ATPase